MKKIIIAFLMVLIFSSCSLQKMTTSMTATVVSDGMTAMESESDLWIAAQSAVPLVKILEVLGDGDPKNPKFCALMAMVYGNVAFGFFEPRYLENKGKEKEVWLARVDRYYKKGHEKGLVALEKRFGKGVAGSIHDFQSAVGKAKRKDFKLLFWTSFDMGNYVNLHKDDVAAIVNVPKVSAMIDRVVEVDREYAYGAALAFQAAMLASRPAMLGGNPARAKELFEDAIKIHKGDYLMNKVMYAEWFAIPQKDFTLARQLLNEVLDAGSDIFPEQALANTLAKERAKILLSQI